VSTRDARPLPVKLSISDDAMYGRATAPSAQASSYGHSRGK